ncbi:MAG TPA: hypothetical protein VN041_17355, partial [Microbacterium sp.]|nr:hypothetical protein [Microbacterium sp.]
MLFVLLRDCGLAAVRVSQSSFEGSRLVVRRPSGQTTVAASASRVRGLPTPVEGRDRPPLFRPMVDHFEIFLDHVTASAQDEHPSALPVP